MPVQTEPRTISAQHPDTDRFVISRDELAELLADRSLHLAESKQTAILRRFEDRQPAAGARFDYTGLLLVRMRADDPSTARDLLAGASHAALESDPFIAAVEGTSVSRSRG